MFDNDEIKANQARMESERSSFDSECAEISSMVLSDDSYSQSGYFKSRDTGSVFRFDEYAAQAHIDGVSVFEGYTMPRGQKWQRIKVADEALMANVVVQQWFEAVERRVFALRNDPKSGFTVNVHQSSSSMLALWGQAMWIDKRYDNFGRFVGLSYQSEDVSGVWIDRDAEGNVMRPHRKIVLTAEQALRKFGDDAPAKVREAMDANPPRRDEPFEFIHVIERNYDAKPGRIDAAGMPWKACYYSCKDQLVFRSGGYRTMRRIVSTYDRLSGRAYGRSPAMQILATLRAAQILMQDRMLGAEYSTKGSWLAKDDELDRAMIDIGPDGFVWGGLDEMGKPNLQQLQRYIDLVGPERLAAEINLRIDRAYWRDLLQIRREQKTHISATRTLEETAEKGVLLSPLARQEQEWFAPVLDVELDIMWEVGLLDDMPAPVIRYLQAGGSFVTSYDNQLTQMMEAAESLGYLRTAEQVAGLSKFDPEAAVVFKREYPLSKVIPGLGSANGTPARWRATDAEKAAFDQQKQASAMQQQLLEAAPVIGETAKNLAQAQVAGNGGI